MAPKKPKKQGSQRPKGKAYMPALYWGTHAERKKTAGEAAEKQNACQKRDKIQTAWQDLISEAKVTPKRLEKQGFQRPKGRV